MIRFVIYLGLTVLILASITDIKKREVPDWLSYSLISFGLIFNFVLFLNNNSLIPLLESLTGLFFGFLLAALMFYTGQWGGGDAKILMGLGSLLGIPLNANELLGDFFLNFNINLFLAGGLYGVLWSVILLFKHKEDFVKKVKELSTKKSVFITRRLFLGMSASLIIISFFLEELRLSFLSLSVLTLLTFYLWLYIKSIEQACMIKKVRPSNLVEGDWIAKDFMINGKFFVGPKDLGISKEKIGKLLAYEKKKKKNVFVMVKEGIPFIPSFLLAYLMTIFLPRTLLWIAIIMT
ncbi:prepilin peptidase [Candidatus Woesearchaeota archaeon]|nr:prepilin peptidase [Candidatus Woesearchaeota archaeon]